MKFVKDFFDGSIELFLKHGVVITLALMIVISFSIVTGTQSADIAILNEYFQELHENYAQQDDDISALRAEQDDLRKMHGDMQKLYEKLPWDLWEKLGQNPDSLVGVEEQIETVVRVELYSKYDVLLGSGSAVCIKWDGVRAYFLTAAHVVLKNKNPDEFQDKISIVSYDNESLGEAVVMDYDVVRDLAIISIEAHESFPVAEIAANEPKLNARVIAVGCSLGMLPLPTEGLLVS